MMANKNPLAFIHPAYRALWGMWVHASVFGISVTQVPETFRRLLRISFIYYTFAEKD